VYSYVLIREVILMTTDNGINQNSDAISKQLSEASMPLPPSLDVDKLVNPQPEAHPDSQTSPESNPQPEAQLLRKPDPASDMQPDQETDPLADDKIGLFTKEQNDQLTEAVSDAFSALKVRARPHDKKMAVELLRRSAMGDRWKDVSKALKLDWVTVSVWRSSRAFSALYQAAHECGNEIRQVKREEEADRRAMDGYLDPVYWDGKKVGTIRRYSDKLLEIQLKANSAKYRDKPAETGAAGGGITLNIVGVTLGAQPAPNQYPAKTVDIPSNG
jgi:hypothetical protein